MSDVTNTIVSGGHDDDGMESSEFEKAKAYIEQVYKNSSTKNSGEVQSAFQEHLKYDPWKDESEIEAQPAPKMPEIINTPLVDEPANDVPSTPPVSREAVKLSSSPVAQENLYTHSQRAFDKLMEKYKAQQEAVTQKKQSVADLAARGDWKNAENREAGRKGIVDWFKSTFMPNQDDGFFKKIAKTAMLAAAAAVTVVVAVPAVVIAIQATAASVAGLSMAAWGAANSAGVVGGMASMMTTGVGGMGLNAGLSSGLATVTTALASGVLGTAATVGAGAALVGGVKKGAEYLVGTGATLVTGALSGISAEQQNLKDMENKSATTEELLQLSAQEVADAANQVNTGDSPHKQKRDALVASASTFAIPNNVAILSPDKAYGMTISKHQGVEDIQRNVYQQLTEKFPNQEGGLDLNKLLSKMPEILNDQNIDAYLVQHIEKIADIELAARGDVKVKDYLPMRQQQFKQAVIEQINQMEQEAARDGVYLEDVASTAINVLETKGKFPDIADGTKAAIAINQEIEYRKLVDVQQGKLVTMAQNMENPTAEGEDILAVLQAQIAAVSAGR